ncbi:MAG: 4Fe-4S binding protein [Spirochaetota bacterium]
MKRKIISIDEDKCTGCGLCVPDCPEGALRIVDGKARLVRDLYCDGLGACLGTCPEGAIEITEREAEEYNEYKVMENIVTQGSETIKAHLTHLQEHNEAELYNQAVEYLKEKNIDLSSNLTNWPVQMHLINPRSEYFKNSDFLLAADCTAFVSPNFNSRFLKNKTLGIACPELDSDSGIYTEKIKALIDDAEINTLTVLIMTAPCCQGLLTMAKQSIAEAKRKIPLKCVVLDKLGNVVEDKWV